MLTHIVLHQFRGGVRPALADVDPELGHRPERDVAAVAPVHAVVFVLRLHVRLQVAAGGERPVAVGADVGLWEGEFNTASHKTIDKTKN